MVTVTFLTLFSHCSHFFDTEGDWQPWGGYNSLLRMMHNVSLLFQVLAKKMTVLYKLASEQLSKQNHYDFGLRALKSVLVMAGELKRGSPKLPENVVLMRALR